MLAWAERFADELWAILLESGVWLILGLALAGVVHAMVPIAWVRRQLGGRGVIPIAKAAALGLPVPLCSCSVIPVSASLRRAGAGKGASAAFTISTPQTGEESIPLTWALFGPVFAITRPIVAIVTAFIAGVIIDRVAPDDAPNQPPDSGGGCSTAPSCCSSKPEPETPPFRVRALAALRYGFVTLPTDLALWLIVGLVLAAVVAASIPAGWIGEHLGTGVVPMVLVLLVGVPVYVCATSSTPLAFALVAAGMNPGAALVFLLAGPATNAATMAWVLKDLGARALVIYLAVIATVALGAGLAFDALLAGEVALGEGAPAHQHAPSVVAVVGAIALSACLVLGAAMRFARRPVPAEPVSLSISATRDR